MTVYVSTAAVSAPRELWAILAAYRDVGIDRVELGFCDLDDVHALGPRLRSLGLDYLVHNYFPPPPDPFVLNLASSDRELARRSLEMVLEAIDLTAELGAPFYSVHAGWITDPIGFDGTSFVLPDPRPGEEAEARSRLADALGVALARAEERDVGMLLENNVCTDDLRGKLLVLEADDLTALLRELGSSRLGLLLDTGHLNVTARTLGFDRLAFVDTVASYVRALHVHDNDGVVDQHRPIESGTWVQALLRRPVFAGVPVTVEAKFPDATAAQTQARFLTGVRAAG